MFGCYRNQTSVSLFLSKRILLIQILFAGNEAKVYEFVVRHFLACVSKDAQGHETIVQIDINGEKVRTIDSLFSYKENISLSPSSLNNAA